MDIRECRHIVVLARLLSFTKASEELGLSQSALSRSIQAIERRINIRLFDRDRGGVYPTAVGKTVIERASQLLREANDLERMVRKAASGEESEIAFGIAPLPAKVLLPKLLVEELPQNSGLPSYVSVRNPDDLMVQLIDDQIEFLVCFEGQALKSMPLKGALLGRFPISLLVRTGHPALRKPAGGQNERYPLLVYHQFESLGRLPDYFRPYVTGVPRMIVEDYGVLGPITENSDAVWLGSSFGALEAIREGRLTEIPPPDAKSYCRLRMMMYSPVRRSLSPAAIRLKRRLQELIRSFDEAYPPP